MFDFLQGLAFGLLTSVMPWFLTGLYDPGPATMNIGTPGP